MRVGRNKGGIKGGVDGSEENCVRLREGVGIGRRDEEAREGKAGVGCYNDRKEKAQEGEGRKKVVVTTAGL